MPEPSQFESIEVTGDLAQLDAALEALPNSPAVFLLWAESGEPYLSKTTLLRRRLLRLLKEREKPSRLLNLRHAVKRIEYRFTSSALESSVIFYEQARRHFPETYLKLMKLHMPPYVKLILNNQFPRTQITTHLARVRRKVRRSVPRPFPNPSLPGRPRPFARSPRLHLRRDGDVPAPLPGSS